LTQDPAGDRVRADIAKTHFPHQSIHIAAHLSKETFNTPTNTPEASEASLLSLTHNIGIVPRSASNGPKNQLIGTLESDENTGLLYPLQIFRPLVYTYVGGAKHASPGVKLTHRRYQLRCAAHAAESYKLEDQENEVEKLRGSI
jgi:hypothetical protein